MSSRSMVGPTYPLVGRCGPLAHTEDNPPTRAVCSGVLTVGDPVGCVARGDVEVYHVELPINLYVAAVC